MTHKHRIKTYTWFDGRLFTENHIADTLEEAKHLARDRGPHSFKIFNAVTSELLYTEILVETGFQIPEYA